MKTDVLLDENYSLVEDPNTLDFVEGDSDEQHMDLILLLPPGSLKHVPTSTVGLVNYLNADNLDDMLRETRAKYEADGMTVNKITYDETTMNLTTDAYYKS